MAALSLDDATGLVSMAVLAFVAVRLVSGVRVARSGPGRATVQTIRRRLVVRHLWPVPVLIALVLSAATALMAVPGLDWGWWTALGGEGNPVFGSTEATTGTVWEWLVPLVFLVLLVPALPLFAYAEERVFRAGAEGWSRTKRVLKVLQFGVVHAVIGIPIGAALALSVGGAWFMWVYLRAYRATGSRAEATFESATAHTAYNGAIIAIVIVAVVLIALGL